MRTVAAMSAPTRRRMADLRATSGPNLADTLAGTWMSLDEVCELLGETRSTLDKWRARGAFPAGVRKPNRRVMFRREDVASFIESLEADQ